MQEKDYIERLFAEKLGNAETAVKPELWSSIASKIPAASGTCSSAVVAKGLSSSLKWFIGLGSAACVSAGVYFLSSYETKGTQKSGTLVVKETKNDAVVENKENNKNEAVRGGTSLNTIDVQSKETDGEKKVVFIAPRIVEEENIVVVDFEPGNIVSMVGDSFGEGSVIRANADGDKTNAITNANSPAGENHGVKQASSFKSNKLPNAFTVNNDGNNDVFFIEVEGINDFVFNLLNDKNEVVFSSNDSNFKWDGRDRGGNLVPQGKYIYFFTGKDDQGNPVTQSSTLSIFIK